MSLRCRISILQPLPFLFISGKRLFFADCRMLSSFFLRSIVFFFAFKLTKFHCFLYWPNFIVFKLTIYYFFSLLYCLWSIAIHYIIADEAMQHFLLLLMMQCNTLYYWLWSSAILLSNLQLWSSIIVVKDTSASKPFCLLLCLRKRTSNIDLCSLDLHYKTEVINAEEESVINTYVCEQKDLMK